MTIFYCSFFYILFSYTFVSTFKKITMDTTPLVYEKFLVYQFRIGYDYTHVVCINNKPDYTLFANNNLSLKQTADGLFVKHSIVTPLTDFARTLSPKIFVTRYEADASAIKASGCHTGYTTDELRLPIYEYKGLDWVVDANRVWTIFEYATL